MIFHRITLLPVLALLLASLGQLCSASEQPDVWFIEETNSNVSLDSALYQFQTNRQEWTAYDHQTINLGLVDNAYWFIWPMTRVPIETDDIHIAQIQNASLDLLNYWFLDSDFQVIDRGTLGDHLPFRTRPIQEPNFSVRYPNNSAWIVVRAQTTGVLSITSRLYDDTEYLSTVRMSFWYFGIFCGVALAMMIYNAFLSIRLSVPGIRSFSLWALSMLLYSATLYGYGYQYLWPEYPLFQAEFSSIVSPLTGFTCLLVTLQILDIKHLIRRKLLLGIYGYMSLLLAMVFGSPLIGDAFSTKAGYLTVKVTALIVYWVTGLAAHKGAFKAKILLAAWVWYSLLAVPLGLLRLGVQIDYTVVYVCSIIGSGSIIVLFSFILSFEARRVFNDRKNAALTLFNATIKDSEKLNKMLSEKTAEVKRVKRQLLVEQFTDANTGLRNDAFFRAGGARFIEACKQRQARCMMLLVDIDNFEELRAFAGFPAYDQYLANMNRAIKAQLFGVAHMTTRLNDNNIAVLFDSHREDDAVELINTVYQHLSAIRCGDTSPLVEPIISLGYTAFTITGSNQLVPALDCAWHAVEEAKNRKHDRVCYRHFVDGVGYSI